MEISSETLSRITNLVALHQGFMIDLESIIFHLEGISGSLVQGEMSHYAGRIDTYITNLGDLKNEIDREFRENPLLVDHHLIRTDHPDTATEIIIPDATPIDFNTLAMEFFAGRNTVEPEGEEEGD